MFKYYYYSVVYCNYVYYVIQWYNILNMQLFIVYYIYCTYYKIQSAKKRKCVINNIACRCYRCCCYTSLLLLSDPLLLLYLAVVVV